MNYICPNSSCTSYQKSHDVVKNGSYIRKNDSRKIRRFKCTCCGKRFSQSTLTLEYHQKKRRVNYKLWQLLCSGVSMRRAAMILNINKTTVSRKVVYLAKKAYKKNVLFFKELRNNPVTHLQFDDLITIEHTKLKPLSITVAVDINSEKILGAEVSTIPAFGLIAAKSREKYGYRKSTHFETVKKLLSRLKDVVHPESLIESDQHKMYPQLVKMFFPKSDHRKYKGGRGSVVGQGELKKLEYDPIFGINHTCAMLRANINRLIRKTWCTTKSPSMLQKHLDIYMWFHNSKIKA